MTFAGKLRGFLTNPTATFGQIKEDTLGSALIYALIGLVIMGQLLVSPWLHWVTCTWV